MQQTGATLIFATTTPVPEKNKERREPATLDAFNKAAVVMLQQRGVHINDLYAAMVPKQQEYQLLNNVHFNKSGYSFLGRQVAKSIAAVLQEKQGK